jgi:hypothetical protein
MNNKKEITYENSQDGTIKVIKYFLSIYEEGRSVIISFFSTFFLNLLTTGSNQTEVFILLVEGFILWSIINYVVISYLNGIVPDSEARQWHTLINNIARFITLLLIYLVIQYITTFLKNSFSVMDLNLAELLAATAILIIATFSISQILESLTNYDVNKDKK